MSSYLAHVSNGLVSRRDEKQTFTIEISRKSLCITFLVLWLTSTINVNMLYTFYLIWRFVNCEVGANLLWWQGIQYFTWMMSTCQCYYLHAFTTFIFKLSTENLTETSSSFLKNIYYKKSKWSATNHGFAFRMPVNIKNGVCVTSVI